MIMRCTEAGRWISVRADGEKIPSSEAEGLERHLEGCASCREVLEEVRRQAESLDAALRIDLPTDEVFEASVIEEAIARPAAAPIAPPRFLPRAALGMAAGILIALGLRLTVFGPVDPPPAGTSGAYRPTFVNVQSVDRETVTSDKGRPFERGVKKERGTIIFPAPGPRDPEVKLDFWNERTDYLKPVDWTYY
jgi:anti-sigma factor RsiW